MWPNPHADLVTFTEEILNVKLHFLCFVFAFEQNTYIVGYVGLQQEKLSPPPSLFEINGWGAGLPIQGFPGSKPGGSKVDTVFHPSVADKMKTRNSWELLD